MRLWERAPQTPRLLVPQPSHSSLGIFLRLPGGTLKVAPIRLLRKVGTAVRHFGLGVPTCHAEGISRLPVGPSDGVGVCTHSLFLTELFTASGPSHWLPPRPGIQFPTGHPAPHSSGLRTSVTHSWRPPWLSLIKGSHIMGDLNILFIPSLPLCQPVTILFLKPLEWFFRKTTFPRVCRRSGMAWDRQK